MSEYYEWVERYLNSKASQNQIDAENIDLTIQPRWTGKHTFNGGAKFDNSDLEDIGTAYSDENVTEYSPVFNIKAYGATGNDAERDDQAIRDAIDACEAEGGGTIFFPPGETYGCLLDTNGSFSTTESDIRFLGYGAEVKVEETDTYITSMFSIGGANSVIEGLALNGESGSGPRGTGISPAAPECTFRNLRLKNFYNYGIYASGGSGALRNVVRNVSVDNVTNKDGIRMDESVNTIENCSVTNTARWSYTVAHNSTSTLNVTTIRNCYGEQPVDIEDTPFCRISDCKLDGGINFKNTGYITIEGVEIVGADLYSTNDSDQKQMLVVKDSYIEQAAPYLLSTNYFKRTIIDNCEFICTKNTADTGDQNREIVSIDGGATNPVLEVKNTEINANSVIGKCLTTPSDKVTLKNCYLDNYTDVSVGGGIGSIHTENVYQNGNLYGDRVNFPQNSVRVGGERVGQIQGILLDEYHHASGRTDISGGVTLDTTAGSYNEYRLVWYLHNHGDNSAIHATVNNYTTDEYSYMVKDVSNNLTDSTNQADIRLGYLSNYSQGHGVLNVVQDIDGATDGYSFTNEFGGEDYASAGAERGYIQVDQSDIDQVTIYGSTDIDQADVYVYGLN